MSHQPHDEATRLSALPLPADSLEARVAWFAAWLGLTCAAVAMLPNLPVRAIAAVLGAIAAFGLAPTYLRRVTPLRSVLVTIAAAALSVAVVVRLSGVALGSGDSFSQSGGAERPAAWLLTATAWCFGTGLLATGRLILNEGYRNGHLGLHGYRWASLLPIIAFSGFLVVGVFQVGGTRADSLAHNWAAWAATGSFWFGMVATVWSRSVSRWLRIYSAIAAVTIIATWGPSALRFLGLTDTALLSTLAMELTVFPLSFVWFGWIAHELSAGRQ